MKKVIYKAFWAWEFEKEEQWLNAMSAKGLQLTGASLFRYVFEEGVSGEYQYRLEFLDHWPNHPESQKYIEFMEETGAEQVSSMQRWVYFRKKTSDSPFELFSDIDSRIHHLQRIHLLITVLLILMFSSCIRTLCSGITLNGIAMVVGIAVPQIFLTGWLAYGIFRIGLKIKKLKRERDIHE